MWSVSYPHVWLADGDSLMGYIAMMDRQIAKIFVWGLLNAFECYSSVVDRTINAISDIFLLFRPIDFSEYIVLLYPTAVYLPIWTAALSINYTGGIGELIKSNFIPDISEICPFENLKTHH